MEIGAYIKKFDKKYPQVKEKVKNDLAFQIGRNVERLRLAEGYSQRELARKVKTKQPSIARLESGVSLPSLRFLLNIAHILNVEVVQLIKPRVKYSYIATDRNTQSMKTSTTESRHLEIKSPYPVGASITSKIN